MLAGGLRHREQHFNAAGARAQATMVTLAAITLVLPAAFQVAVGADAAAGLVPLSISISTVLLMVYGLYLAYTLVTHSSLFSGSHASEEGEAHSPPWSVRRAALVLGAATVVVAWMSEILVGAIQPTARSLGLSSSFVGVFVVAILGNA